MSLVDYFSPIFLRGLRIETQLTAGSSVLPPYVEVRDKLVMELEEAKRNAVEAGHRQQDAEEAAFAVAAWLDESAAKFPEWWAHSTPIQKLVFATNNAGNEFFDHLNRLNRQQDEIREVYFVALCLGFTGQYYYEAGDEGELGRIRESLSRQLPRPLASLAGLGEEKITPQPYTLGDPTGPRLPMQSGKWLLHAAIVLAILIPVLSLLYLLFTQEPKPTGPTLTELVDKTLGGFDCARLEKTVDEQNRNVVVQGRVAGEEDRARLGHELAALPRVSNTDIQRVNVEVRPFCAVMNLLDSYVANNQSSALGLGFAPVAHGLTFTEGEDLILQLQAPVRDGYLYVDYFQKDGNVVHLFPNALEKTNFLPKSSRAVIGHRQPGKRHWEILPPFGREMITVVSNPQPLFGQERNEVEQANLYLSELQAALQRTSNAGGIGAAYLFIETRGKSK
jgi:type IV/VI secretion system ImpK/VasF family protein